jgi:hypothetical protein
MDNLNDKDSNEAQSQPSLLGAVSGMSLNELKLELSKQQTIYSTEKDLIKANNANWRMTLILNELNNRNDVGDYR